MHRGELLLDAQKVQPRPRRRGDGKGGVLDPGGIPQLQQVIEPHRPLDVRQGFGVLLPEAVELVPRDQDPLEVADELLQMVLHDPIQGHQIQVDVVDDLHVGVGLVLLEKEPGRARKDLHVTFVLRNLRDDFLYQQGFSAHIRQKAVHVPSSD